MKYEISVDIQQSRAEVWAILTDIERWPEWTSSITRAQLVDGTPLALGSRARIKQPLLPPMTWEVTEFAPQRSFTWRSSSAGMTTVAEHRLSARVSDGVIATLRIRQTGPWAPLIGVFTSRLTRAHVETEAEGLKRRCEARMATAGRGRG